MLYKNKIVLITGSRRGIGKMLTNHFLREGANVIGISRHDELENERYLPFNLDISNPTSVNEFFLKIRKNFGRLDIVINCAGVLTCQHSMLLNAQAVKEMLDTNVLGTFLISREAAKLMRINKWGRIICIGSMAASLEPIGDSIYAATKTAICTMTNIMAKEFANFNITCNTIGVTAIETDMLKSLSNEIINKVILNLTLPRYTTPDDIFNVVDFFASEKSNYVTAQTIYLGGVN